MTLHFKNTLGGELEPFEPLEPGRVRMYSCGPTVYAPAHVGNFRAFVFADLVHRTLRFSGYEVTWVMNITDVDDKIIRDAGAAGQDIADFTAAYTQAFLEDFDRLNIERPDIMPRATEHIEDMVALIETLLERDHAYRTDDGSIFFRIASWPAYGRLARIDPEQQRSGERVEADEYDKESVRDFALWKGPKPGEPSWSTSIGEGRPGWHIECSAMSMRYLGPGFDLHTGGVDLVFPHHEDEIAQSEAATGTRFVRTWLHNAHLQMGGAKMAKSTGNIARPAELYEAGVSPRALRYALLVAAREAFTAGLHDDLNISAALAATFDLVRELNGRMAARSLSTADAQRGVAAIHEFDTVLGVLEEVVDDELEPELAQLLEDRVVARAERDWARSDELRDALAAAGVVVEDTPDGQRWRRS